MRTLQTTTDTKTAIGYVRVSTQEQATEGVSLDLQRDKLRAYCKLHGWSEQPSGTTNDLIAVWGSDANNAWSVGILGALLRWNGSVWTPQSSGTNEQIMGVWGLNADNVWTVAATGVIRRWDGRSLYAGCGAAQQRCECVWALEVGAMADIVPVNYLDTRVPCERGHLVRVAVCTVGVAPQNRCGHG